MPPGGSRARFHLLVPAPFASEPPVAQLGPHPMRCDSRPRPLIACARPARSIGAAARDPILFAGPLCRLHAWHVDAAGLHLTFGLTDYHELVGTNLTYPDVGARFGDEYLSNGAGVCAAIETSDGMLLVQRRGER